jgi:hypothetical protein
MIGVEAQPRDAADHLGAVHVGQAEVKDHHVGAVAGRDRKPEAPSLAVLTW